MQHSSSRYTDQVCFVPQGTELIISAFGHSFLSFAFGPSGTYACNMLVHFCQMQTGTVPAELI